MTKPNQTFHTCCFFGHRTIEESEELKANLTETFEKLIVEESGRCRHTFKSACKACAEKVKEMSGASPPNPHQRAFLKKRPLETLKTLNKPSFAQKSMSNRLFVHIKNQVVYPFKHANATAAFRAAFSFMGASEVFTSSVSRSRFRSTSSA